MQDVLHRKDACGLVSYVLLCLLAQTLVIRKASDSKGPGPAAVLVIGNKKKRQ